MSTNIESTDKPAKDLRKPSLVLSEVFPPQIGGSGNWLHEIYRRQPTDRTVMLVGEHEASDIFDAETELRIVRANLSRLDWTLMNTAGIAYFFYMLRRIISLQREYKFADIHCARVLPEGFAGLLASRLLGIRLVCFIHGEDIEIARHSREHRWLTQLVLARADRLVCNCENSRSLLLDAWRCDDSKVRVLNPGIDTARFRPSEDREQSKASLGWSGRKVILTVSRLDERKGHDKLIEAMPYILERVPNVLYVIVGGGFEKEKLEKQVVTAGMEEHVIFSGPVDDEMLLSCYQSCDLFVLPNRQIGGNLEGFGIVLLEAQACGRPVIAGDNGGTSETMLPGESGLLLDCNEAGNLVTPIVTLLLDPDRLEAMGRRARAWMLEKFCWERITESATHSVFLDDSSN